MTKRSDEDYLNHILDAIEQIEEYCAGLDHTKFIKNKMAHDAVIRQLEIIGEASKKLDTKIKQKSTQVPWKAIAGTRDVLIHQYFGIDLDQVWQMVQKDLPLLKKEVRNLLV